MACAGRQLSLVLALAVAALAAAGCGGGSTTQRSVGHGGGSAGRGPPGGGEMSRYPTLAVPSHVVPRQVRIPILTYHRVHVYATELTKSQPDLTIEPPAFQAEMAALHRAGYRTITQRQLFAALYQGAALPPRPVIVSVDDGYVDDVTQILPVLKRYGMRATFYVITGRMHEAGFLRPSQIQMLERSGMDVGAHTRTHANLPALDPATLRSEVDGSRRDLERVLGHPVYWFAYPYGAFNARVVDQVRKAGFLLAVTTRGGVLATTAAPLEIPRIHVGRTATATSVLSLAGGAG